MDLYIINFFSKSVSYVWQKCFFVKSYDILTDFVLCDTINFALWTAFKMCKKLYIELKFQQKVKKEEQIKIRYRFLMGNKQVVVYAYGSLNEIGNER